MIDLEAVKTQLKQVFDPEIGINVVDLGLIYRIEELEPGKLHIEMTMTTPGCPAHDNISQAVEWAGALVAGASTVIVDVVWDPPWSPEKMSDEARAMLNF